MPATRRSKLLHRIYAILTLLWIAWLTLILPMLIRHRAEVQLGERLGRCSYFTGHHQLSYDGECMDHAEHLYFLDKAAATSLFTREGLPSPLAAGLGLPLLIYCLAVIPAMLLGRRRWHRSAAQHNPA